MYACGLTITCRQHPPNEYIARPRVPRIHCRNAAKPPLGIDAPNSCSGEAAQPQCRPLATAVARPGAGTIGAQSLAYRRIVGAKAARRDAATEDDGRSS